MRVPLDPQAPEIFDGLGRSALAQIATQNESAQRLCYLDVNQVRRMQGRSAGKQQIIQGRGLGCPEKEVQYRRGIGNDQRASRSARSA